MGELGVIVATWGPHGIGLVLVYFVLRIDLRVSVMLDTVRDHEMRIRHLERGGAP